MAANEVMATDCRSARGAAPVDPTARVVLDSAFRPAFGCRRHGDALRPRQADLLRRHGLRLDKKLGQHFLVDDRIVDRIVDEVAALGPDRVVEMACGAGALTFALLERGWPVTGLEIDERMLALLRAETAGQALQLHQQDLAATDFELFVPATGTVVFAGNLPYQLSSPILFGLLPALRHGTVGGAVVMVQAEVGQRMAASPGGRTYGILSVLLQAECRIRRALRVRPGSFLPPPEVDSEVMVLTRREDPVDLGGGGRRLVKELFAERRKQIGGLLRRRLGVPAPRLHALPAATGLDPAQRAETLSPEDFARLAAWVRGGEGEDACD